MTANVNMLGIDYGQKRIGLAYCENNGAVLPLSVLENTGLDVVAKALAELIENRGIDIVVIGLPLHMSGEESDMVKEIRELNGKVESELETLGREVRILERDERLTSWDAERAMMASGQKPWKDKGQIDTRAAMLLLSDYLAEINPAANLLTEPPEEMDPSIFSQKHGRRQQRGRKGRRRGRR